MDQAGTLRRLSRGMGRGTDRDASSRSTQLRGLAVASGKGGVGKTNIVANLALTLSRMGKKTLILDADMGLGNIHILLGIVPRYTLQHVISGERTMQQVLMHGPGGIDVLPAGSGSRQYNDLSGEEMLILKTELEVLEESYDYVLFDIGAGISNNVMYFCSAVEDTAIITSTEPTSFADAYAVMKVLSKDYGKRGFKLIVNNVRSASEGKEVYNRLSQVSDRFGLNIRINYLGHIFTDKAVPDAVRQQRLFTDIYPTSQASVCIHDIAKMLTETLSTSDIEWGKIFA